MSPFPPKPEKKSPFPDPSLPQAGESSREALINLWIDRLMFPVIYALAFVFAAVNEWVSYWLNRPPSPWLYTIIAILCVGFTAWRFFRLRPAIEAMALGIRGERIVGRMLEDLRRDDYRVFHDLPGEGDGGKFNVDHLIVGPAGVFVIETKTISKPGRGKPVVTFDGERVLVNGQTPDRDPVAQSQALAAYVRTLLRKNTGREIEVRAVILYPKWWVEGPRERARIWVLNPEQLAPILRREARRLSREDIALFSNAVEVAIRQMA